MTKTKIIKLSIAALFMFAMALLLLSTASGCKTARFSGIDDAAKVQHEMAVFWGVNFSEASLRELKIIAKAAWQELQAA